MSDAEFRIKMTELEMLTGEPFGTFTVHIWDDRYMMGTDTLAYMIRFPYPMYRGEAIEALIYVARGMGNERR